MLNTDKFKAFLETIELDHFVCVCVFVSIEFCFPWKWWRWIDGTFVDDTHQVNICLKCFFVFLFGRWFICDVNGNNECIARMPIFGHLKSTFRPFIIGIALCIAQIFAISFTLTCNWRWCRSKSFQLKLSRWECFKSSTNKNR